MSKSIANVQTTTDTFAGWIEKTNEMADTFTRITLTAAASEQLDIATIFTTGNAVVNGVFSANALALTSNSTGFSELRVVGANNFQSNVDGILSVNSNTIHQKNWLANGTVANISVTTVNSHSNTVDLVANVMVFGRAADSNTDFNGNQVDFDANNMTIDANTFTATFNTSGSIVSNNFTISTNSTIVAVNVHSDGSTTTTEVLGDTLNVSANVHVTDSVANVHINPTDNITLLGQTANLASTNTEVRGTQFVMRANVDLIAANVTWNATKFHLTGTNTWITSTNTDIRGADLYVGSNTQINNANTKINATQFTLTGTSSNVQSNATFEGSTVNVAVTTLTSTANVDFDANTASFVANTLTIGDANTTLDINANTIAIDAATNTVITSNNFIIQSNSTIQAYSLQGNSSFTSSTINGDQLDVTANVFMSAANVTIGNNAADLLHVDANTDFNQWVMVDSYLEVGNSTVGESNTYVNRVRSLTDQKVVFANATNFTVTHDKFGWESNTTLRVGNSSVYVTANTQGDLDVTGNTVMIGDLDVRANTLFGNNTADFHTFVGNTTFGDSVNIDDQLTVGANVQVANSTAYFFYVDTTNRRIGVNTDTPDHLVHAVGNSTHHTVLVEGTANVSLVANAQSTLTGSANIVIKSAASNHIKLHTNNQTAVDKTVIFAANGNFGIGNNTPTHKLRVAGDASVNTDLTIERNLDVDANTTLGTTIGSHSITVNATVVGDWAPRDANTTHNYSLGLSGNTWHDAYISGNTVNRATFGDDNTAEVVSKTSRTGKIATAGSLVYQSNSVIQSAKVIVSGKHSNASHTENQITEVLMVTDGTDVFLTTYGQITTDADNTGEDIFTLSANVDSGVIRLYASNTANYANVHVVGFSQGFRV